MEASTFDKRAIRKELQSLHKSKLVRMCGDKKLAKYGNKTELINRLIQYETNSHSKQKKKKKSIKSKKKDKESKSTVNSKNKKIKSKDIKPKKKKNTSKNNNLSSKTENNKNANIQKNDYDKDIINELLQFDVGTKQQIMNAMDMVINKNDINEIIGYLAKNENKLILKTENNNMNQPIFEVGNKIDIKDIDGPCISKLNHRLAPPNTQSIYENKSTNSMYFCLCGAKLVSIEAKNAYCGYKGISCNKCGETEDGNIIIYHCPNEQTSKHERGYDLCSKCVSMQSIYNFALSDPIDDYIDLLSDLVHSIYDNKKNEANCPGKHGLEEFRTPNSGWDCNLCCCLFSVHIIMYGCSKCDYVLCSNCYKDFDSRSIQIKQENLFGPDFYGDHDNYIDSDGDSYGSDDNDDISNLYHAIFRTDIPSKHLYPYQNSPYKEELLFFGFIRSSKNLDLFGSDIIKMVTKYCDGFINIICNPDAMNIISQNDKLKSNELKMKGDAYYNSNKFIEAIDVYTKATHCNPNDYYLFLMQSKCYLKLTKYEIALEYIQNALELEPGSVNSWYYRGIIESNLNDFERSAVSFKIAMEMITIDKDKKMFKFEAENNEKQNLIICIENDFQSMFDRMRNEIKDLDEIDIWMEMADDVISGEVEFLVNDSRDKMLEYLSENEENMKDLVEKIDVNNQETEIKHNLQIKEYVDIFDVFLKHDQYKEYIKEMKWFKLVKEAYYNNIELLNQRQFRKSRQDDCFWFVTCTSLSKIKYNKRLFGILIMATYEGSNCFNDVVAKYTVYGEPNVVQLIQILKRAMACNISNDIASGGEFRFFVPRGIIFGDNFANKYLEIKKYFEQNYDLYDELEIVVSINEMFSPQRFWRKFEKARKAKFPKWIFNEWNNLNMFKWHLIH